jgi:hypothetical protein
VDEAEEEVAQRQLLSVSVMLLTTATDEEEGELGNAGEPPGDEEGEAGEAQSTTALSVDVMVDHSEREQKGREMRAREKEAVKRGCSARQGRDAAADAAEQWRALVLLGPMLEGLDAEERDGEKSIHSRHRRGCWLLLQVAAAVNLDGGEQQKKSRPQTASSRKQPQSKWRRETQRLCERRAYEQRGSSQR